MLTNRIILSLMGLLTHETLTLMERTMLKRIIHAHNIAVMYCRLEQSGDKYLLILFSRYQRG